MTYLFPWFNIALLFPYKSMDKPKMSDAQLPCDNITFSFLLKATVRPRCHRKTSPTYL